MKPIGDEFYLVSDDDGHWYVIPSSKEGAWREWRDIPSDDERAWEPPEFAEYINGPPSNVKFTGYRID